MRALTGASAKQATGRTLSASIVVDPAVPMFHSNVPPEIRAPGMNVNSRLSTCTPSVDAPQRAAQARTLATCCVRRPRCSRFWRTLMTLTGSCSNAASATEYRTIVPLPECWLPSIVTIGRNSAGERCPSIAVDVQELFEYEGALEEEPGAFHRLVDVLVGGRAKAVSA